jgi:hypothetical protein
MTPTKEQDRAYIEQYWDVIAAVAWTEFMAHGRGALVVENTWEAKDDSMFIPLEMMDNPLMREYADYVRTYDPRQEVVLIFLKESSWISVYKVSLAGRDTPPDAHRRLATALSLEN